MELLATIPNFPPLAFDGERWSGDVPNVLLAQLNTLMASHQRQHYSAYDIALEVLPLMGLMDAAIEVTVDSGNEAGADT